MDKHYEVSQPAVFGDRRDFLNEDDGLQYVKRTLILSDKI